MIKKKVLESNKLLQKQKRLLYVWHTIGTTVRFGGRKQMLGQRELKIHAGLDDTEIPGTECISFLGLFHVGTSKRSALYVPSTSPGSSGVLEN